MQVAEWPALAGALCVPDQRAAAVEQLEEAVATFVELDGPPLPAGERLHHAALSAIHALCAAMVTCEEAGCSREEIVRIVHPVREIHTRSPFVARLQQWPRGYPGDFETVEAICSGQNRAPESTLEHHCEAYSLGFPIAQQHRNKVRHQERRIAEALLGNERARILSIACGGCPDFRGALSLLIRTSAEIHLNDSDPAALDFAAEKLAPLGARCHRYAGNAVRVIGRFSPAEPFDLILAGGLFDYLSERWVVSLIEHAYARLRSGGVFFFTNIAEGNPYRVLIEHIGDWFLIERSEDELRALTEAAGVPRQEVSIERDETGLAFLVDVRKRG